MNLRIAIGTHVFETVDFKVYFNHLFCVAHWAKKHDLVFIGKSGLGAATARNAMIERCFETDCTHVFFLDGDHLVPRETLDFLVESADQAMISGLVCKKGERFQQVCWEVRDGEYYEVTLPLDGRVYETHVCAFGCTLINLKMLKKLKKPYFRDTCIDGINIRSDVNLCNAFRDNGEKIWVDTRILVGHMGPGRAVYPQNAKVFENLISLYEDSKKLNAGIVGTYFDPGGGHE